MMFCKKCLAQIKYIYPHVMCSVCLVTVILGDNKREMVMKLNRMIWLQLSINNIFSIYITIVLPWGGVAGDLGECKGGEDSTRSGP